MGPFPTADSNVMKSLLQRLIDFRTEDEFRGMLQAAVYGFCIMFAYYILRAVRDEISAADRGNLQILWTAVFFVMIFAVQGFLLFRATPGWRRGGHGGCSSPS